MFEYILNIYTAAPLYYIYFTGDQSRQVLIRITIVLWELKSKYFSQFQYPELLEATATYQASSWLCSQH